MCVESVSVSVEPGGERRLEPPRCRRPGVDNAIAKGERSPAATALYQIDTRQTVQGWWLCWGTVVGSEISSGTSGPLAFSSLARQRRGGSTAGKPLAEKKTNEGGGCEASKPAFPVSPDPIRLVGLNGTVLV